MKKILPIFFLIALISFKSYSQKKIDGVLGIPYGLNLLDAKEILEKRGYTFIRSTQDAIGSLEYSIQSEEYPASGFFLFKQDSLQRITITYKTENKEMAFVNIKQSVLKEFGEPNIRNEQNDCIWMTKYGQNTFGLLTLTINNNQLVMISVLKTKNEL